MEVRRYSTNFSTSADAVNQAQFLANADELKGAAENFAEKNRGVVFRPYAGSGAMDMID